MNPKQLVEALQQKLTLCNAYFGPPTERFRISLQMMDDHFRLLMEDKEPQLRPEEETMIRDNLNFLKDYLLQGPLWGEVLEFTTLYTKAAKNWNDNLPKDPGLNDLVQEVYRISQMAFTITELLVLSRQLLERAKVTKEYAFPSIELSRHYIRTLDEYIKEGKDPRVIREQKDK